MTHDHTASPGDRRAAVVDHYSGLARTADPQQRGDAEQQAGCMDGTLTRCTATSCKPPDSPASTSPPPTRPAPASTPRSSNPGDQNPR